MRVLCVAAHPDDEVLGVGGTLARHLRDGDEVTVALLYPCRVSEREVAHAEEASGFDYEWYVEDVDDLVARVRPSVVYTHSRADLHQHHHEALQRTLVACRPQSGVRAVYAFETPSATDWSGREFRPQRYVTLDESSLAHKLYIMEAYASELREAPHPRNLEALRVRAQYWGQRAGVAYAEPFEVIRECV